MKNNKWWRNFKVFINVDLNEEQRKEIDEFLDFQDTTDCEKETTTIDFGGNYGDYKIRVYCEDQEPVKIIIGPVFADLITEAREKKGLTQYQVADQLGIYTNSYQQYEYGKRIPETKVMLKLIKVLDLDIEEVEKALE